MDLEFDESGFDEIDGIATEKVEKLTGDVARDARRYVPVLTGDLRETIEPVMVGDAGRVYTGADGIEYWADQEYGTSKMEAQPFMRPALYQPRAL